MKNDDLLTPHELKIFFLFSHGLGNREIAETMAMSEARVKHETVVILEKLGARDRRQAVERAMELHGEDLRAGELPLVTLRTAESPNLKGLPRHGLRARVEVHSSALLSFEGLASVHNVVAIDAANCSSLESIEDVRGRDELVSLRLTGCVALQNIDVVESLVNLESLILTDCTNIRPLRGIAKLEKLRELILWGNANVPKDLWRFYKSREAVATLQTNLIHGTHAGLP